MFSKLVNISYRKLNNLERNIQLLLPYKRQKRGIVDGLGTAIKFITGNMDSEDAKTIYTQLNKLQTQESNSKILIAESHMLNNKMIERVQNITKFINNQQEYILQYLDKLSNKIQKETNTILELQYISQVDYNIDSLNNHLKDIIQAISLAKADIISQHIFDIEEITEIKIMLENEGIKLISDEHLYELLELQAFYNNSNIIFNIKIPQIDKTDCELFNVFPLPINQTKRIVVEPFIAYNEKQIQFFNKACKQVESIYYCKQTTNRLETAKSTCIGNIFKNKTPSFHLDEIGLTPSIYQPREQLIILINVPETLIKYNCRSPNETKIKGTALINFNRCIIEVNGVTYTDTAKTFWDKTTLIYPPQLNITPKTISTAITIPKLQEYDIKYDSSIIALQEENVTISTVSTIAVITLSILIIIAITLALRKHTKIIYEAAITQASSSSFWPSLYSRGGGVTLSDTPTTSQTLPPPKPNRLGSISAPTL